MDPTFFSLGFAIASAAGTGYIAYTRNDKTIEHRLTRVETKVEGSDGRLERIETKVDRILMRVGGSVITE